MVTQDENILLTQVGPGTPGGELQRRYWQPIAASGELTDEKPIKKVRCLGEDLVVYKDKSGGYGLVGEQCPHRLTSLAFGMVDDEGIRCPYHGWKFDATGACLETPAEPQGSTLKDSIKQPAYPVRMLGGMLFGYLGADPAPALPNWDVLAWEHGKRWLQVHTILECNWLQCMENSVDPSHLYWLHGKTAHLANAMDHYEEKHEFIDFEYGIMKRRITPAQNAGEEPKADQHPLLFPNTLRHVSQERDTGAFRHNLQFRMPVDDEHTQVFVAFFSPNDTDRSPCNEDAPVEQYNIRDDEGEYRLDQVLVQDAAAWENQGPVMDRSREQLGAADKGIAIFRRLLKEQIELVQNGGSPLGVVEAGREASVIELDVINERIGLMASDKRGAA
jgi:5,5'-dehydrodivanillate O-demethylase